MTQKIAEGVAEKALEALNQGADMTGFCLSCGNQQDGVEPDAKGYKCDSCDKGQVMGAEDSINTYGVN